MALQLLSSKTTPFPIHTNTAGKNEARASGSKMHSNRPPRDGLLVTKGLVWYRIY